MIRELVFSRYTVLNLLVIMVLFLNHRYILFFLEDGFGCPHQRLKLSKLSLLLNLIFYHFLLLDYWLARKFVG